MPFKSGHPGYKKPGTKHKKTIEALEAQEYIKERVLEALEPIMSKAINQAKSGDVVSRRDLFDRAFGKPKETIELQGLDFKFDNDEKNRLME